MVRTGQPLFLKDLNCGCINPLVDQVLNPAAWTNPTAGTFGPGPNPGFGTAGLYYADFRQPRRPTENFNIGRNFVINRERGINLQIRAEFTNIFNRMVLGNPATTSPYNGTCSGGACTPGSGAYQGVTHAPGTGNITGGFGGYALGTVATGSVPTQGIANGAVQQLGIQPRQGTLIARFTF